MLQHSGLTLAYLGDALYDLLVREQLIAQGETKVDVLHNRAIQYTSASGQHQAYRLIEPHLTEEEQTIFKRGRNAKTQRKAKNQDLSDYRQATGLEALFGYLYLDNQIERIDELMTMIMEDQ
ncbi:Mini-ribonuclease 3 [Candidatus Xianfuyuplasma coldseepsis]|uniref:Mini-ribonuclease 3 n=1 Tax=Candidatus Xianfuyuplasma coldseepsis TaxID=2782163 RepID=A0A7L7KRJ0_9MOLU|nr:ribonuclease III domain-containing protein [Xianfuyuplasma coldseepsis]QMS85327.1 Mini-ribonuclease 3 [Xianfuyuplasma coldseepsis]